MASRWFRRKVSQRWPRSGLRGARRSQRETDGSDTWKPSLSNSPWIRGAPQVGFSAAIRKISSRTSLLTVLRPRTALALEIHFQYKRKPARCHSTTVRGVTRTRGLFHPDQSCRRRTQNSLCIADNRGRGRLACTARSCSRRARFSRTSSSREPKARITQPMRCRSDENMAEILPELRQQNRFQLAHFKSARRFDEEQGDF